MNYKSIIAVAVILLTSSIYPILFFTSHERVTQEENTGYSQEARRNNFYAAELFLKKYGMEIKSMASILQLKKMPDTNDVLFIPTERFDLGKDRVDEIMKWVNKGGHLIAVARYNYGSDKKTNDLLFERLGVTARSLIDNEIFDEFSDFLLERKPAKKDKQAKEAKQKDAKKDKNKRSLREVFETNRTPILVEINNKQEEKRVYFNQDKWMSYENSYEVGWHVTGKNGAQLLEFIVGDGRITLLSDINFMRNRQIDKFDHAAFLYSMVHLNNSKRNLWLIRSDDSPSLLSLMFTHAKPALIVFAVLLFAWLWYASRRFGPIAPNSSTSRRSVGEHIISSGYYYWRNRHRSELLASVQKAIQEQLAHTRPAWLKLSDEDLAEKIAGITHLDKTRILKAITATHVEKELEFTAIIEVLSIIRKKL